MTTWRSSDDAGRLEDAATDLPEPGAATDLRTAWRLLVGALRAEQVFGGGSDEPRSETAPPGAVGRHIDTGFAQEYRSAPPPTAHRRNATGEGRPAEAGAPPSPAPSDRPLAAVRAEYHRLSRLVHPDLHAGDADARELAHEACARLNHWFQIAEARIAAGIYGTSRRLPGEAEPGSDSMGGAAADSGPDLDLEIRTRQHRFILHRVICEGDLATIYAGTCPDAEPDCRNVIAKVALTSADNPLIQREDDVLKRLWTDPGAQTKHLPVLLDRFKTTDGLLGSVFRRIDALDGVTLRERFPKGVPAEHAVWIMERCLSILGYAHSRGILHGNLLPAHVMVRPRDHNVFLVDWCTAVVRPAQTGDRYRCFDPDFHAPEVERQETPTPASDLFALGRVMLFLLGVDPGSDGHPTGNAAGPDGAGIHGPSAREWRGASGADPTAGLPAGIDDRLRRFLRFFLLPSPRQRAQDAWEMVGHLRSLRQEIFGTHRFVEFRIPG